MVLGKVIGEVKFARGPVEVELALVDSVFHPPVTHVERFGKLLAHFGIEDTLSSVVISVEGSAGARLPMAEFFECGTDGASVFATDVDPASFSFSCGGDDIFNCLAEDVNGAIDAVAVVPTEVIVDSCSAPGLGLDEVGCVGCDFENHIARVVADDGVRIRVKVIHQHVGFGDCVGCWGSLFRGELIEGGEDARVTGASIEEESTTDGLDADGSVFVQKWGLGRGGWVLGLA